MEIKAEPLGQTVADLAKTPTKKSDVATGTAVTNTADQTQNVSNSPTVTAKIELNHRIIQSSLEVSLNAGNEPMALLFKTALEGVNEALKGQLGDNAIQKAYDSGLDVSPQATADRIVKMSTGFFEQYKANHSELSTEDALNSFVDLIGGGIDKGFKEARDILGGLKVLDQGNIGTNIDSTYDLVQKGLQDFVANYKNPETTTPSTSATATAVPENSAPNSTG